MMEVYLGIYYYLVCRKKGGGKKFEIVGFIVIFP